MVGEAEDGTAAVGDAIDEWLGFLCGPAPEERDRRLEALPDGTVPHVHATKFPKSGVTMARKKQRRRRHGRLTHVRVWPSILTVSRSRVRILPDAPGKTTM